MSGFSSGIQYKSLYVSVTQLNMALQQETTLTIQDSWWLRSLLVARRNKELDYLSLLFCVWMNICVCFCPFWRANGKTTRSDRPRRLTDELTGSDALFIKKDQLGLRRDGGQHLDLRQGHTLHCWVRLRSTFKLNFAAISLLFSFLLLVNDWTASPRASCFHTNHQEVVL